MAHIKLNNENLPGIDGLLDFRPEIAKPLMEFIEELLRGSSPLSKGERELIASSVSYWNHCHFCHNGHGAVAAAHLNCSLELIDDIKAGLPNTAVTPKLRALLDIAHRVQEGGKNVTAEDVAKAKEQGATDVEIHDTVLIAAAFCMINRYVDGLGTWAPELKEAYKEMGEMVAKHGYASIEQ